jgi:two-component system OmpR family sensor kinase
MRILALSLIAAVFAATVGLGWLFDKLSRQYQQSEQDAPLSSITAIEKFGSDIQDLLQSQDLDIEQQSSFIANWPISGNYQLSLTALKSLSLPDNLKQQLLSGEPLTLASTDDIVIYYYLKNTEQLLMLTSDLITQQEPVSFKHYLLTSLFYLSLFLLMLLWLYPLITRLLALRAAAKSFGQGKLEQRVKVGSVSYIRDLEIEFNHMAQRISDLVSDVKLLSSAVSHDLRTPLATIRFGMDTLQEEEDPQLRKKFEQRISKNVDEMIELVEILLNYARLDQSLISLNKSTVRLEPMLQQILTDKVEEHIKVALKLEGSSEASISADSNYLSMLFKNLIQNAKQHCKSQVVVSISTKGNMVRVSVSDDGSGVPADMREQIVKPFVRGAEGRKGYGVGLAIVQRITHWHNGELLIDDDKLGGARFTVALPIKS